VPSPAGRPSQTGSDADLLARGRLGISNQVASDLLRQIGPETKMTAW
jgi:hypothetical protein